MGIIKGYDDGANITILNTVYHKSRKMQREDGKQYYSVDSLDIIYKDLDTNEKKMQHIESPDYIFWMANPDVQITHWQMFIEKSKVHPVKCKYLDIKYKIADITGNVDFFIDNLKSGNYKENDKLFMIPNIFNADMNIEDYYRWIFDRTYRNEPYPLHKLYFDIEVDTINMKGDFPEPGECPVNAITLVDEGNQKVYTLLLNNYKNPLIDEFKITNNLTTELKNFVREKVGGEQRERSFGLDKFEYRIMFYDEEIELIKDTFNVINTIKPDFALAWNIAFDLPYLIARIGILGYAPESIICHPDFPIKDCYYFIDHRADKFEERGDFACISSYTVYMDQLISFASRRKGQRAVSSFKLDFIGDFVAGVRKLDYSHITTNLAKLPYLDYHTFVFYNVMDTIVQLCVESKSADIDFIFNKALSVNTRYSKVHRQTTYLMNRAIKDFWDMGYVLGNNINKSNPKVGFPGAFVADPLLVSDKPKLKINGSPVMICDNLDDFDYKALYPSIIDENNMAPNTQHGKILLPEKIDPKENRFNNDYFDRAVWFSEDLVSGNRLDFCQRYLNLADYEEMYDDVIKYFTTIVMPCVALKQFDTITGKKILCFDIAPECKKRLAIDSTHKKLLCIDIPRKMVDINESNNNNSGNIIS